MFEISIKELSKFKTKHDLLNILTPFKRKLFENEFVQAKKKKSEGGLENCILLKFHLSISIQDQVCGLHNGFGGQ